jgi:hypothetical protein
MNDLYLEIYKDVCSHTYKLLQTYIHDEEKSYEAGMALMMLSMKMLMFSGVTKESLFILHENIEKTFDDVYKDFQKVDMDLKE